MGDMPYLPLANGDVFEKGSRHRKLPGEVRY